MNFLAFVSIFTHLFLFTQIPSNMPTVENTCSLTIQLPDLKCIEGSLMVALYRKNDKFISDNPPYKLKTLCADVIKNQIIFHLPEGEYAAVAYHDKDDNGKLDKNFIGYPTEPFGFSNNPRVIASAPSYIDCSFMVKDGTQIKINWN